MADYSMANRKIAYTLARGRAYISDMSSTSGYMGATYFQEFGPRFVDMSSASGYMGAKYFHELCLRFLACQVPNVACHGVSISIVSISSVSCRVRILRVSMSMPCRGHPEKAPQRAPHISFQIIRILPSFSAHDIFTVIIVILF